MFKWTVSLIYSGTVCVGLGYRDAVLKGVVGAEACVRGQTGDRGPLSSKQTRLVLNRCPLPTQELVTGPPPLSRRNWSMTRSIVNQPGVPMGFRENILGGAVPAMVLA